MAEFKDRLKQLRIEKGLTQQELADLIRAGNLTTISSWERGANFPKVTSSRVALGNYERGEREPNKSSIISLAEFFDVTIDYLLGVSDERVPVKNHLSKFTTDELIGEILKRAVKND